MLFRMILDGARDEERPIARGFLKHIVLGFAAGLAIGCIILVSLFLIFGKLNLNVPLVFIAAMMLQFGPIGGLVGAGIYLSRITDRSEGKAEASEEDDEDDRPGGGTKAPVTPARPASVRRPRFSPLPAPA